MRDSYPFLSGAVMGFTIYAGDMLFRPRLGGGLQEMLLFLVEGAVCDLVYNSMKTDCTSDCSVFSGMTLKGSAVAGITIFISDLFLRPQNFGGLGSELIKFLIQGMIVMLALTYL